MSVELGSSKVLTDDTTVETATVETLPGDVTGDARHGIAPDVASDLVPGGITPDALTPDAAEAHGLTGDLSEAPVVTGAPDVTGPSAGDVPATPVGATGYGAIDTRTLSRSLFLRLASLESDSTERAYVRDTLIELNLPLVRYAAARFRSRNEPMEDIVQVGTIGLIKAIDRFDCERGVEFPTFAMPTVVGEIKRFFRDTSWSVRVPRRLQELRLALTKASDELSQTLDRSPTVAELASCLGVSEDDVVDGLAVGNAYTASSLDSPSLEEDGGEGSLADRLGYEDTALEGVEYRESLKPLLAKLPPRERQIIMLRFFANMTQSQIGEEVGISQMHVSRLPTRTLAQLREGLITED
ncbi:RNA polymerase sigma factor SigF [Streptomyces sp. HNM0574]|uniref:RNA polymerase sigma factor SigF n=1 Tax=Streptomyces sp. HNM0574 TaxID=2714954 RepID=UPI001469B837|nr:RNA polymerase sigma factor SigF [Streptomyces sp. HNM0574]NLU67808.1 RNA polymerase sigma factor SigF [Streptomyces sp. HNM0574]